MKHGRSTTPEYRVWAGIIQRCTNPKNRRFADYGGRGINVCGEWLHSFKTFYADMGPRPSAQHSIDRCENDAGYSKSNCRWATRSEQQRNKRAPNTVNLRRGDAHWTRQNRARAREIGRRNIAASHGFLEANGNAKLTAATARSLRALAMQKPHLTMAEIGAQFGVGRETARKVIRGILW